jgi:starch synthase
VRTVAFGASISQFRQICVAPESGIAQIVSVVPIYIYSGSEYFCGRSEMRIMASNCENFGVCLLTSEYPPEVRGGAGVHVFELAHRLSSMVDVVVDLLGGEGPALRSDIPLELTADSPRAIRRTDGFGGDGPHSYVATLAHAHSLPAHLKAAGSGLPFVSTAHSVEAFRPWRARRHRHGLTAAIDAERAALDKAHVVICVSEAVASDLRNAYELDNLRVVSPGYAVDGMFPDPRTSMLPTEVLRLQRPFVLASGRISAQKGYRHLFDVLRVVRRPTTVVLRAGAPEMPDDRSAFAEELERLPDRHTVVWLERGVGRQGMRQLYSAASLHVSTSVYEPYGLTNIEAMLCGTPAAATRVGGVPEALAGTPGLLMADPVQDRDSFQESLEHVIEEAPYDLDLRARVRAPETRRLLMRGDWSAVLPKILDTYRETIHA